MPVSVAHCLPPRSVAKIFQQFDGGLLLDVLPFFMQPAVYFPRWEVTYTLQSLCWKRAHLVLQMQERKLTYIYDIHLHYDLMSHEWNRWPQKTLDSKPSYRSTVGYLPRWGCDNNTHRCSSIFQGCAMFGVATRRLQICSTIDLWDATISEKQHIFEGWRLLSEQGNATFFFLLLLLLLRFQLCQNFLRCSDDACVWGHLHPSEGRVQRCSTQSLSRSQKQGSLHRQ